MSIKKDVDCLIDCDVGGNEKFITMKGPISCSIIQDSKLINQYTWNYKKSVVSNHRRHTLMLCNYRGVRESNQYYPKISKAK